MNDLNQLEKQLESLIPRPPSSRLKNRLFPHSDETTPFPMPLWLKLAPAVCLALVTAFFFLPRREQAGYLAVSGSSNMLACLSSNLIASCASDLNREGENVWSVVTFDWTKNGVSTTPSFPLVKTNIQKL